MTDTTKPPAGGHADHCGRAHYQGEGVPCRCDQPPAGSPKTKGCPVCGAIYRVDDMRCGKCGATFDEGPKPPAGGEGPEPLCDHCEDTIEGGCHVCRPAPRDTGWNSGDFAILKVALDELNARDRFPYLYAKVDEALARPAPARLDDLSGRMAAIHAEQIRLERADPSDVNVAVDTIHHANYLVRLLDDVVERPAPAAPATGEDEARSAFEDFCTNEELNCTRRGDSYANKLAAWAWRGFQWALAWHARARGAK